MAEKKFITKNGLLTTETQFVDTIGNSTQSITLTMDDLGTLSFSGTNGQLFSVTDNMEGTIFAVNDISGVPSIEVDDNGTIRFAELFGNILVGTATDNGTDKLQVAGNISVTGTVDGRDIATDGSKLDGIAASANNYSLPLSANGTRGGVQIGYAENGKNYPVELSSEKMFVNVPWTDTVYSHPTFDGDDIALDTTGAQVIDTLTVTTDTNGHVTDASVTTRNLTASDIGAQPAGNYVTTASAQALHATDALSLTGNILYLNKADGTNENVDLSLYLDDTNLSRIISGTYDSGTQELVFTRDDDSEFRIDASMFFDDTNLVTSVDGRVGTVTLTDKYLGISAKAVDSDKLDGLNSTQFLRSDTADTFTSLTGTTLTATNILATSNGTGTAIKVGDDVYLGDINEANVLNIRGSQDPTKGYINFGNSSGNSNLGSTGGSNLTWGSNNVFHDGYHPNADKLTTARTISLSGDAAGSVSFDGSQNVTIPVTITDDSHSHVISNVDGLQNALDSKLNLSGGTMSGNLTINKVGSKVVLTSTDSGQSSIDLNNNVLSTRWLLDGDDLFRVYNQTSGFDAFAIKSNGNVEVPNGDVVAASFKTGSWTMDEDANGDLVFMYA